MMLDLTNEELKTLQEVLENDIAGLKVEVLHTDTRQYRELLKHKEQILEKILARSEGTEVREPEKELLENQIMGR